MTVAELREIIRETVREALLEMVDPDAGLEFKPEIAEYLEWFRSERPHGTPIEEAFADIGIDD
jgi:hypothetical protein